MLGHNTFHPNSLLHWHCGLSHCWSVGIGDGNMNDQEAHRHPTMKEVHAADQLRNLSLSGSLLLSFSLSFFFFSPTQDKPCSWALRLARPWESQLHSVSKSGSPNLRLYRHFGLSGLRNPLLFRHFALPGAWFFTTLFRHILAHLTA